MSLNTIVAKVEQSVRPRHVGIGFVWAWIYCSFSTSALFAGREGSSINADPSWLSSAIAVSGCLLALAFAWRRVSMGRLRGLACVGAALMAAGTFGAGAFSLPGWASAVCGVASGVGSAALILFWGDALSRIETERVEIAIPAASGVMLACVFVFPYIQGLPGVLGVTSLPLLSLLCLFLTWDDIDAGRYEPEEGPTPEGAARASSAPALVHGAEGPAHTSTGVGDSCERGRRAGRSTAAGSYVFLARMSIVLAAAYFAIGVTSATGGATDAFQDAYGFDAGTFIGSVFGIGLAFWFIFFSPRLNVAALLRWVSPLLVVGMAAMPFSGVPPEFVVSVAVSVADTVLQVIAFLSLVNLVRAKVFSPAFAIGVGQGAIQLGVLAGNLFGNWSQAAIAAGAFGSWVVSLFAICVLSVAMAAAPSDRHMGGLGFRESGDASAAPIRIAQPPSAAPVCGATPARAANPAAPLAQVGSQGQANPQDFRPANEPVSPVQESLDAKVARIAAAGGLSARETEVLGYLARGRSQPYIRDELVLSKNTVASHVKHIYQKLDVHSRQELLDLFA